MSPSVTDARHSTTTSSPTESIAATTITTGPPDTIATTTTAPPYVSEIYKDPANWICRGDMVDICDNPAPLTEVAADGTLTVEKYEVATDPPIDCFYVYPTISNDATFNSDLVPSNEIGVTGLQAARFNQVCKVYAPVYRSVTLGGLFGSIPGDFDTGGTWPTATCWTRGVTIWPTTTIGDRW